MNADSDLCMTIDGPSAVYRKSGSGASQLVSAHGSSLSARERQVLILLDGRRTIEELSEFFGAEAIWSLIASLEAKGFAKRVDPQLPPEWADGITRIGGDWPVQEPPAPKPSSMASSRWHHDWFALVNLGMLVFVIAMVTGLWAIDRRHAVAVMPFGATHGRSIASQNAAASTEDSDATDQDHVATAIVPLAHLPAVNGPKAPVATAPSHGAAAPAGDGRDRHE
jgi:hypothetical protein